MAAIDRSDGLVKEQGSVYGDAETELLGLVDAHDNLFNLDPEQSARREAKRRELAEQIHLLTKELNAMNIANRAHHRSIEENKINRAKELRSRIRDVNSGIHPVLRAVLLAPEMGRGSLADTNTFEGVHSLGLDMVAFHNHLEKSSDPQPAIVVKDAYDHSTQQQRLQINYGFTVPGVGLRPDVEEKAVSWHSSGVINRAPRPILEIPVAQESVDAASPSTYNSHWVLASREQAIEVQAHGKRLSKALSDRDILPTRDRLTIPLPTTNLYDAASAEPFTWYETTDGRVEVVTKPAAVGEADRTLAALGRNVVPKALIDLVGSKQQDMNAEQRRVLRDMVLHIANDGLGLVLKSRQLPKKP